MTLSQPVLAALLAFPLGACVGSFLNVVAYRLPLGMSLSRPASHCPYCREPIRWRDNLPILGWIFLLGRARCCRQPVSPRYPLVELLTGVLWSLIALHYAQEITGGLFSGPSFLGISGLSLKLVGLDLPSAGCMLAWQAFASVLVAASLIDLDEWIIPDILSLGATIAGIVLSGLLPGLHPEFTMLFPAVPASLAGALGSVCGALVGAGALLAMTLAGTFFMSKRLRELQKTEGVTSAIGYGDVKLMAAIGSFGGWQNALLAILCGCFYGALAGVVLKLRTGNPKPTAGDPEAGALADLCRRWRTGESLIPFGPFLAAGALTAFFYAPQILTFWKALVFPAG